MTFSQLAAERAKKDGMEIAANTRSELLELVRVAVIEIAQSRPSREATADDAQAWLIQRGFQPTDLGNAAGSVFPKSDWIFTGRTILSSRVSRHRNSIRVWKLK